MNNNSTIQQFKNVFAFVLGRETKIALYELESVLRRFSFDFCNNENHPERGAPIDRVDESKGLLLYSILSLQDNVAIIKTEKVSSFQMLAARLMENLGGTVKIYEISNNQKPITNKISNNQYQIVQTQIIDKLLDNKSNGTLNFGISDYTNTFSEREIKNLGIEVKKGARKVRSVRFVEGKGTELSSATTYHKIFKTGGEEFGIFRITNNQETIINKMTNVQYPISNEISNSKTKECHSELAEESHHRVSGINNNSKDFSSPSQRTHDDNYSLLTTNYLLGRLLAVSNPDEWSKRDYDKPAGDKYSGMMPPKLARMMVNIALGQIISNNQYLINDELKNKKTEEQKNECHAEFISASHHRVSGSTNNSEDSSVPQNDNYINGKESESQELDNIDYHNSSFLIHNSDQKPLVFDPFCGSGNILMEAKMLGCEIMGSDLSEKAVDDTKANLEWLNKEERIKNNGIESHNSSFIIHNSVFKADATSADFIRELKNRRTKEQKNIVVVTEPYLGKPKKIKNQKSKIKDEIKELKSLYLSFFNNLKLLSTHNSLLAITFVFPVIETLDAGEISLYNECVDELRQMGYNPQCTLRYGRDYQVVKRQIVVITMEKS